MMKTLLICHDGARLDQDGLSRWLSSFSHLVGIVVLRESQGRKLRRLRREIQRVGMLRFLDVVAFRFYYKLCLQRKDLAWEHRKLEELRRTYPECANVPILLTHSPNSPETEQFIREQCPDIVLARCKALLRETIFRLPKRGTFVMHPGICPEYRNAHGCFWALVNDDPDRVGMTLLQIDQGVDTGPVYGYYRCDYNEREESHVVIQHRVVFDNLGALEVRLNQIVHGQAAALDTFGRNSATWGQPWLTRYLKWKRRAKHGRQ